MIDLNRAVLISTAAFSLLASSLSSGADLSPTDIPGLVLWLDAADVNDGGNPAHNALVGTWHDKSGSNHDALQLTSNLRPQYITNGISRADGASMPVLRFASDWLSSGTIRSTLGNVHVFVVSQRSATQLGGFSYQRLVSTSDGVDTYDWKAPDWTLTSPYDASGYSMTYALDVRQLTISDGSVKIEGLNLGRDSANTNNSLFSGDIAEVVIFADVITGTDLTNLLAYFNSKWVIGNLTGGACIAIDANHITSRTAELTATLAGSNGTVYCCWGTADSGTNLLNWDNIRSFTNVDVGTSLTIPVTGLQTRSTVWYRFCAVDPTTGNTNWSQPYSFLTRGPFGAIRWDAWTGGAVGSAGWQVERSLGPQHYHSRLPFYGQEISSTQVEVRATTQAIIDKEIAFAHAAGLDYWAYVLYSETYELSLARQLHQSSSNKMDMNFCVIHEGHRVGIGGMADWPNKIDRYLAFFQQPNYQKVLGNRPLYFCLGPAKMIGSGKFANWAEAATAMEMLRTACMNAGLGSPYMVVMDWGASTGKTNMNNLGFDAISQYALNGNGLQAPYSTLTGIGESYWNDAKSIGAPVVPPTSAGWDRRPRAENPVSWEPGSDTNINKYYERPTPAQLGAHVQTARDWCAANPAVAEADTIIMYAWNEIDEGGWILPTLLEKTAHLEAMQTVLNPVTDSDGDGMPDLWEVWNFDSVTNAAVDTDSDSDGSLDWKEYVADTDPKDAKSRLAVVGIDKTDSGVAIDWTGGSAARQILERKSDLSSDTERWATIYTVEPNAPVTNTFIDVSATNSTMFYRIRAERP